MQTTRRLLLLSPLGAFKLRAADFWKEKDPAAWTDREVERMVTRSPWAKQATVSFDAKQAEKAAGGGARGGGLRGGMGGGAGATGDPGGAAPGMDAAVAQMSALVRWESALPVRLAANRNALVQPHEHYVVSISGLPLLGIGGRVPGGDGQQGLSREQRRAQLLERLQEDTRLVLRNKDELAPLATAFSTEQGKVVFSFSRTTRTIELDDREVQFLTRLGGIEVKAKFNLTEMVFRGKLEL